MLANQSDGGVERFLKRLYPFASQAARILSYFSEVPGPISLPESDVAARVGLVSAEHVAIVVREMIKCGFAAGTSGAVQIGLNPESLSTFAQNLLGVDMYKRHHKDSNTVDLVLTEPGDRSALRTEIDRRGLPPRLFQTRDAFLNLARSAEKEFVILVPFIDDEGCQFLIDVFSSCNETVQVQMICRPLMEPQCGVAFRKRKDEFKRLRVSVYEYALPSMLPSRRETFHAKVVLADDRAFYVGSSNFMGSALDRSLECGVIVRGQSARELYSVVAALKAVSRLTDQCQW